jgi:hypothetical protein
MQNNSSRAVVPPAEALAFAFSYQGEPIDDSFVEAHVQTGNAGSRLDEVTYICQLKLSRQAIPASNYVDMERGDSALSRIQVACSFYGEEIGNGSLDMLLLPPKRWQHKRAMAAINAEMAATLRSNME